MENDIEEDFLNIIKANGFKPEDFDWKETNTTRQTQGLFPVTGEIEITLKKNGVTQKYKTGHGSEWLSEFTSDLKANGFKK